MNCNNIKNGIGFITNNEIYERLSIFTPPEDENYCVIVGSGNFITVGLYHYGVFKKLFCLYSSKKELYDLLIEMIAEAVFILGNKLEIVNEN